MRQFRSTAIALAFGVNGELPTEFRLFTSGWNDTEHGRFLFDADAAAAVMAHAAKWGVDLAIDLEHQMLDAAGPDPTARDARGWCRLELRDDGSLWAVGVKWTQDGAARLAEKRQRYVSPAFDIDPDTKRVIKVLNVAITALPATHNTPALVAASVGAGMDPKQIAAALDALIAGDAEKCAELLKGIIATAAGASADATAEPAAVEESAASSPAADSEEEKKAEAVAASAIVRLSGKNSFVATLAEIKIWRASHLELETERKRLAAERETLESAERRRLCVQLVTDAGRAPANVWADDKAVAPKRYLASMSIEDLREYVSDAVKAAPKSAAVKTPAPVKAAASSADEGKSFTTRAGVVTLSASEIAECNRVGAKLEVFAENKAIRDAQRARAGK